MLKLHHFPFSAMGTACSLHLYSVASAEAGRIAQVAIAEVLRIERRYSRYRPDSDLSAINRTAEQGGSVAVDEETAGLLHYAFAAYKSSDGLFDISSGLLRKAWDFKSGRMADQHVIDALLPCVGLDKVTWHAPELSFAVPGMQLDFGGLGKEYAADRAAEACLSNGAEHGVVDLGGDMRVMGPHPNGAPWQIGIRHPRRPSEIMAMVAVADGALATSGDYERCIEFNGRRYSHMLHPRSGWPVQGLSSVTVITDRCLVAGSACTIAMLKGGDGIDWLKSLGVEHAWMDETGGHGCAGSFLMENRRSPTHAA